jgi:hypothetical protein
MSLECFNEIESEWIALQKEAPPKPKGLPSNEELVELKRHKQQTKEFLAKLSKEDKVKLLA